jgi:hypothetical protein
MLPYVGMGVHSLIYQQKARMCVCMGSHVNCMPVWSVDQRSVDQTIVGGRQQLLDSAAGAGLYLPR